jgi:hypothetical protein
MGSSATTETESAAARPCSGRISPMENCPDWLLALCAIASFVRPQPRLGERRHITAEVKRPLAQARALQTSRPLSEALAGLACYNILSLATVGFSNNAL